MRVDFEDGSTYIFDKDSGRFIGSPRTRQDIFPLLYRIAPRRGVSFGVTFID
jgi:hypothetical protein